MANENTIISSVVLSKLDEFSEANFSKTRSFLSWTRERQDGLFEKLAIQKGSPEEDCVNLNINFVLHYFEECPNPSGVFGADFNLVDLPGERTGQVLSEKYLGGLDWLILPRQNLAVELGSFFDLVRDGVRKNLEKVASELASDSFRRSAVEYFQSLRGESVSKDDMIGAMESLGEPKRLLDRGPRYTSKKAATQLYFKLNGRSHWAQV